MDGLAALVRETLGADPFGGVIYVFRAASAPIGSKLLFWDGTGLVLAAEAIGRGVRSAGRARDGVMRLTPAQLSALLEGLDWARVRG